MAIVSRKAIAAALLAQLVSGGQFASYGRRLRKPEQAASPGKPGLYLIKGREHYKFESEEQQGVPPRRFMEFLAVIYTDTGADEAAVPADVIDDLLDAIDTALAPGTVDMLSNGGRQTLGGLVYDARIEGDTDIAPGDVQGKGSTTVSIRVVLP
jgi:hypothetical protein